MHRLAITATAVALLVLVGMAAAHRDHKPTVRGPWRHDKIEGCEDHHYTSEHKLYRVKLNASSPSTEGHNGYRYYFADELPTTAADPSLAAILRRKENASNWQYVMLEGIVDPSIDTADSYYAAGFAEGYSTMDGIWSTWVNQVEASYDNMRGLAGAPEFIDEHLFYYDNFPTDTPFGAQLRLLRNLVDGLTDGWQKKYAERKHDPKDIRYQLNRTHMYLTSYMEELLNVNAKFEWERRRHNHHEHHAHLLARAAAAAASDRGTTLTKADHARQHCSALVRRTEHDVFLAHDTWGMYDTMLRQFKTYKFGDHFVAMSGYPGSISSIDDFYMTSHKLAITETTNGFFNNSLYDHIKPTQISTFNRAMIANFLAETPKHWFELFAYNNSGTYNNQWIITNLGLYEPGQPLLPGTLWILEQMPGVIVAGDQTGVLERDGYWASYNVPFYPKIYAVSGTLAQYEEFGDYFSYTKYARAEIFRRNVTAAATPVNSTQRMKELMRFNNWQQDPLSAAPCKHGNCTPSNSPQLVIACRADLSPLAFNDCCTPSLAPFLSQSAFGAIDAKFTSKAMQPRGTSGWFISGPTRTQQPTFDWNTYESIFELTPHVGQPARFDFNWTIAV